MPKETIPFSAFLEAAGPLHTEFINQLHEYLLSHGCTTEIKLAANGYVVSYLHKPTKRTVINYVFRKKGPLLRVYADNIAAYEEILTDWPKSMKDTVKKAGPCKRLLDPTDCNSRCPMGYVFDMNGKEYKNCRYGSFMFEMKDENHMAVCDFLHRELTERLA